MCQTPYAQTNTNHTNKACAVLETTGGKDELNTDITTRNSERKDT